MGVSYVRVKKDFISKLLFSQILEPFGEIVIQSFKARYHKSISQTMLNIGQTVHYSTTTFPNFMFNIYVSRELAFVTKYGITHW
jgi:hypothetical protein